MNTVCIVWCLYSLIYFLSSHPSDQILIGFIHTIQMLVFIATLSSWKSDWAELSWMVQVPDFEIVKCLPSTHTYIHRLNNENDSFLASSSARRPCFLSTQLLGSAQCARTSHTQSVTYISHPDFKWSSRGSLKGQIGSVPSLSGAHSEPAIIPVYFLCWWLWHAVDM